VRRFAGCKVGPAGSESSEWRIGVWILIAEGSGTDSAVVERDGIRFSLLQTVHEPVASNAIIKESGPATHHQLLVDLIRKSDADAEIGERRSAAHGKAAVGNQDALRRSGVMRQEIVRHHIPDDSRTGGRRTCGWDRNALNQAQPAVRQVAVDVAVDS